MRVLRALVAHLRSRRHRPAERLEPCEAPGCKRLLKPREVYELVEYPGDDDVLDLGGIGGTYMTSTFCAEHAPANSVQPHVARRRHP